MKKSDRKLVLPYEELIERIEELGGATILAHPAIAQTREEVDSI